MTDHDHDHDHEWKPLLRWGGRYRCQTCSAIGYRANAAHQDFIKGYDPSGIYAYQCQQAKSKGGCKNPAIGKRRHRITGKTSTWYCVIHKPKELQQQEEFNK